MSQDPTPDLDPSRAARLRYARAAQLPEGDRLELSSVLPGEGPVLLEIGSGRGAFALSYASILPTHRVLALEVRRKFASLLDDRLLRDFGGRARCFAEDARLALPRLGPEGSVHAVAVHFPDPWWKKKHQKRMVVAQELPAQCARLLAPGGLLLVQTDVEERAEQYRALLETVPALRNTATEPSGYTAESPFAPSRSNREARALADGMPVFRLVYEKR